MRHRKAAVRFTLEALGEALGLPEDVKVVGLNMPYDQHDVVYLVLSGPTMPLHAPGSILEVIPFQDALK